MHMGAGRVNFRKRLRCVRTASTFQPTHSAPTFALRPSNIARTGHPPSKAYEARTAHDLARVIGFVGTNWTGLEKARATPPNFQDSIFTTPHAHAKGSHPVKSHFDDANKLSPSPKSFTYYALTNPPPHPPPELSRVFDYRRFLVAIDHKIPTGSAPQSPLKVRRMLCKHPLPHIVRTATESALGNENTQSISTAWPITLSLFGTACLGCEFGFHSNEFLDRATIIDDTRELDAFVTVSKKHSTHRISDQFDR
ncbi:hypothetical protein SCHPADRAFT_892019 [Schizopora paradoxa]|uniref:Uncharacterized protein n=1 Tax=Schizopora paradoxa TaxID=27342 RepID=A0A0H2RNA0_9AGAM|nr:hypothetical protein SCHPADRAFT_892019 [Schizopora paradoxa]